MSNIYVLKRTGEKELLDLAKIHKVLGWASEGLDVSVSMVELRAKLQLNDGVTTADIHETLIKTAADLIDDESPDYQMFAGRLGMFHIRKKVFRGIDVPTLYSHVKKMVEMGKYDQGLLVDYSKAEFAEMDKWLDHSRDFNITYAAFKQFEGKYLVQNRVTGDLYETPQFLYLLCGACLFSQYDKDVRMDYVRKFYDATSTFKISLPTPIMSGVRTPTRQFSSCVLIDTGDNLKSINATASSIVEYVSQRAGIGVNAGEIRALGSPIRGGEAFHTGCIPFYKYFKTAVKSCSQGGVRGGAATLFYPFWHLECESLLVLKNNRGVEESRERQLDYGVQLNKLMYQRLQQGGMITLFSPSDVPNLYTAFFADQDLFEALYVKYENDPDIRKKKVKAVDLFSSLAQERAGTGRIYIQNVDHCNTHSSFNPALAPIKQSNLCMEITLPTKPLSNVMDEEGEIALCTLAAFNLGTITDLDELGPLADLAVRALDALLEYQDYPLPAARKGALTRRPLGVGTINLAYYFAKNGVRYSDGSANKLTHETFEAVQYYLLKASHQLAREKGACSAFSDTTYSQGILPIDTYKKSVDKFADFELKYDWETLRKDIVRDGLRNSTLTALMPSETSSQISGATNGIEPPRGHVSIKQSKDGVLKQCVPELKRLKDSYELLWDIKDNTGYLQLVAIMQKFVDQSISANTNYDPSNYPEGKVPMKLLLGDLMKAYSYGIKTLYYHNTRDGQSDDQISGKTAKAVVAVEVEDSDCESGSCKI